MDLQQAIEGVLLTRKHLRSKEGVSDPFFISEQMQRLAQYVGAVEEHLADLEELKETTETESFNRHLKEGRSVNMAGTLSDKEVGSLKGQIAKLKRYVNSSWSIIGVSQSRFNHLQREAGTQT